VGLALFMVALAFAENCGRAELTLGALTYGQMRMGVGLGIDARIRGERVVLTGERGQIRVPIEPLVGLNIAGVLGCVTS
jgi:hypothetical protein